MGQQEPSIDFKKLYACLKEDPIYGVDSAYSELLIRSIYVDIENDDKYLTYKKYFNDLRETKDNQRLLIYFWWGVLGLSGYWHTKSSYKLENKDFPILKKNFRINIDELRQFLKKQSLPLPSKLFPGEANNSEAISNEFQAEFELVFDEFTKEVPKLKKELKKIEKITPKSSKGRAKQKELIREIENEIKTILSGKSTDDIQTPTSAEEKGTTRKLKTQDRHNKWKLECEKFKISHTDKSDTWISIQISKMDIAEGCSSETIRKNMKY